jgi:hypothetical protein
MMISMITILTIKTDSQWEDSVDEHGDSNDPLVFSREEDSKFPDLIPLIEDQGYTRLISSQLCIVCSE